MISGPDLASLKSYRVALITGVIAFLIVVAPAQIKPAKAIWGGLTSSQEVDSAAQPVVPALFGLGRGFRRGGGFRRFGGLGGGFRSFGGFRGPRLRPRFRPFRPRFRLPRRIRPSINRPARIGRPAIARRPLLRRPSRLRPARLPASRLPARPRPPMAFKPIRPAIGPGRLPLTRPPIRPRPPIASRPIIRPPGLRPPLGNRPPLWRPVNWRPPYYRPPYVRPPHNLWGRYYWHPIWSWYHTAVVTGATLAFIDALPYNGSNCEQVVEQGQQLYVCDGIVYRATTHQAKQVYEIVPSDKDALRSKTPPKYEENDDFVELKLESPPLKGDRVRTLQTSLAGIGFSVGSVDGVFGQGTDRAVREFQQWYGLPVTGVVDMDTANAIAAEYAAILAPPPPTGGTAAAPSTESQEPADGGITR